MEQTRSYPPAAGVHTPWHQGLFSPLNVAALITWLAVLFQVLGRPDVKQGHFSLVGMATLAAFFPVYLWAHWRPRGQSLARAAVWVQAGLVLLSSYAMRDGAVVVLLIIVAGQVVALWPMREAVMRMVLVNLGVMLIWLQGLSLTQTLLYLTPLIGFQMFAALVGHYAVSAERARAELAQTHGELIATQSLLQDSARSGERLRIARELHDVAGHKLTALTLNLRAMLRNRADPGLQLCLEVASELLQDLRAVVSTLRLHEGVDLEKALMRMSEQLPSVAIQIEREHDFKLDDIALAEVLLRCAQEGITNAIKHGGARRIDIRLQQTEKHAVLKLQHGGKAVPPIVFGNGLNGMRERLAAHDGELSITALADGGCELSARVPVP
jgi:signal transduction histidine kinase